MPRKPSYPGVYVEELSSDVRTIQGVPTAVGVFIGPATRGFTNRPQLVMSFAAFERAFGGLSARLETGYAVRQFFLNGGSTAWVVRVAMDAGLAQIERALQALDTLKDFNLLVLPGVTDPAILAAAAAVCGARRAFLIIDSPVTGATDPDSVRAMERALQGASLPRSPNAAVYFPWLRIPDPVAAGALRLAPPSGTVAGLFARTDSTRGVWKAPAGADATLNGVREPACALTDAQNAVLNPLGVNCLRKFPSHGNVCWGSRTLDGADANASEWKYVPLRRLALYIEESLFRGTKWAVFEPNDETLWSQLRLHIGAFMHGLYLKGAFHGATPKEAYFVKCGRETTTQAEVSRRIVNIIVGFAPLKPAEFIILRFQLSAGRSAP